MFGAYTGSSISYCFPGSLRITILLFTPRNTACWLVFWNICCSSFGMCYWSLTKHSSVFGIFLLRPTDQVWFACLLCASGPRDLLVRTWASIGFFPCTCSRLCMCMRVALLLVRSCLLSFYLDFGPSTCCFACSVLDYHHHSLAPYFKY